MLRLFALSIVIAGIVAPTASEAACGGRWRLQLGSEVSTTWSVESGKTCVESIRTKRSNAAVYGLAIVTQPKHGRAGHRDSYRVAYKSNPGFRGTDSFSFAVIGRYGAEPNRTIVHVTVNIY